MRVSGWSSGPWGVGEAPPAGSLQLSPRLSVTRGWAFLPSGLWTCSGRGGELGTPLRSGELRDGALRSQHPHLRQSTSSCLCLLGWVPRKGSFEKSVLSLKKKADIERSDPSAFPVLLLFVLPEGFTSSVH